MEADNAHVLLVATVGGSPEPVAAAILKLRPARILFVCSPGSVASIDHENDATPPARDNSGIRQRLRGEGVELDPGHWDAIVLPNSQDLEAAVDRLHREAGPAVRSWLARGSSFSVVADFTGGTKCMSVALGLAARVWPCSFEYVGGAERDKGGVGVVVSGKEQVVNFRNPWDALGYQAAEEAATLFNAGNVSAAVSILEAARDAASDGPLKRALHTLSVWMGIYAQWDVFQHAKALKLLEQARRDQHLLAHLFGAKRVEAMVADLHRAEVSLKELAAVDGASAAVVRDLRANAARRMREGRFDDAVARLYRAAEAYGQSILSERHQIRTNSVDEQQVPEGIRTEWRSHKGPGPWKAGLQDAYCLLEALGDEVGARFHSSGLAVEMADGRIHGGGVLAARNQSILAHGFRPVGKADCERMSDAIEHLIGPDAHGFVFPRFAW
jgi:CRISPR-associated protein (TIGR02710 family)